MKWEKGQIDGVIVKKLVKHVDDRGFLSETFRMDELPKEVHPVMSYISYTEPGVCRGPHEHNEQTDIFSFIGPGNFLLKMWDNRKGSKSSGKFMTLYVGVDNPSTVIVPPGIVHGYKNITRLERGAVINYPNKLFMGWGKKDKVDEIRHEDRGDSIFRMEE